MTNQFIPGVARHNSQQSLLVRVRLNRHCHRRRGLSTMCAWDLYMKAAEFLQCTTVRYLEAAKHPALTQPLRKSIWTASTQTRSFRILTVAAITVFRCKLETYFKRLMMTPTGTGRQLLLSVCCRPVVPDKARTQQIMKFRDTVPDSSEITRLVNQARHKQKPQKKLCRKTCISPMLHVQLLDAALHSSPIQVR